MNAVKENVFSSEAKEGERMKGYCNPKDTGFYKSIDNKIIVTVRYSQKWKYQYGMINGENSVKVSRDNVILYLSKDEFEKEWEIDR